LKTVLAFSGGLDTSAILVLLTRKLGHEVITVTVDVGQEDELKDVEEKAYALGAEKHYTIDAKKEFVEEYIFPAIEANALYEGVYPLGTALARPLIASKVSEIVVKEGADAVAHGCTSKGNDQVRFELTLKAFLPEDIKIMAPVRKYNLTRQKSMKLLKKAGFEAPGVHKKYSVDENLWSRSVEGGELDDPYTEPPEEAFSWTKPPERTPDKPFYLKIEFEAGIPIRVNEDKMNPVEMVKALNKNVGAYGYGRIDHVENRVVGLKSREVYEAPAALTLIKAHKDLEKHVLTPHELRFKTLADSLWTDLVYQGLWIEPLRMHLQNFIKEMNQCITGIVNLKIYKGGIHVVGRDSPCSSYSKKTIDYNIGWYPSNEEAAGFITIYGYHSLAALKARDSNAH